MRKLKLYFSAALFLFVGSIFAQITTSSVSGKVKNGDSAITNADIVLKHLPTNSVYRGTTDKQGRFSFENLNSGGPYQIVIKSNSYQDYVNSQIQLVLGDNDLSNITLEKAENQLQEVVIKNAKSSGKNNGTDINQKQVNGLPLINRGIQDVTKLVPQSANNSFAGTNFRYNNVTIDGSINNDAIGFSPSLGGQSGTSGMPGSSTRSNSISLDAIQDIQVYIAPYDIKLGNFLGGSINAVTRSGTNKVSGSVYTYARNAPLTGPNNAGDGSKMPKSFGDYQVGFRLGMPIVKDKLFFFTNMEYAERKDPVFYNAGQTDANGNLTAVLDNAAAQQLSTYVKTNYGFDAGSYDAYTNFAISRKYFNKIDWKINEVHALSLRNNTVISEASNLERDGANFRFSSMDYTQKNISSSTVLEFKSHFNNHLSNSFIASFSAIKDYREPRSNNILFPQTEIGYNGGTIFLGNDREATVFNMKQNTTEFTDNLTYKVGNHTLLIGTHNEFYDINYGFVNALNGRVSYKSLADFYANSPARVRGTYPFDGSSRDAIFNNPYAKFKVNLYSAYVQDEIRIGSKLKVVPGVRVDYADIPYKPKLSTQVQNSVADPNYGTTYNYTPLSQIKNNFFSTALVSPRIGFIYNVTDDKSLVLRGGSGVFTGRIPFAWLGYAYYNDGVGYASFDKNNLTAAQVAAAGNPLVANGLNGYHDAVPKVQADLIDNNFKMPAVLRNSLAIDKVVNGYKFTVEGIYTKVIRDLIFQQVNKTDNPTYFSYDIKKEMPIYSSNINPAFSNAYLLSNTNKGFRYSVTEMVSKTYDFGLNFMVAYTYGDSRDVTNGIRNSMESNFQMNQSLTPNNPQVATSNFNIKHRIVSNIGYAVNFSKNNTLSTNLYFNAQSGNPFTWGFVNATLAGTGQAAGLAYVFKDAAESAKYIGVSSAGVPSATAPQQVADYETFVKNNSYLNSRRGTFTQRNGDLTPWNIQADLKIMDEIKIDKEQRLEFSFSIANVGNLINKNWGKSYFVPNTYNSTASIGLTKSGNLGGVGTGDPVFTFKTPSSTPYTIDQLASRFQGQFGVRYSF